MFLVLANSLQAFDNSELGSPKCSCENPCGATPISLNCVTQCLQVWCDGHFDQSHNSNGQIFPAPLQDQVTITAMKGTLGAYITTNSSLATLLRLFDKWHEMSNLCELEIGMTKNKSIASGTLCLSADLVDTREQVWVLTTTLELGLPVGRGSRAVAVKTPHKPARTFHST